MANYCFPKTWPTDREQRARIIGEWLLTEARLLAQWTMHGNLPPTLTTARAAMVVADRNARAVGGGPRGDASSICVSEAVAPLARQSCR